MKDYNTTFSKLTHKRNFRFFFYMTFSKFTKYYEIVDAMCTFVQLEIKLELQGKLSLILKCSNHSYKKVKKLVRS